MKMLIQIFGEGKDLSVWQMIIRGIVIFFIIGSVPERKNTFFALGFGGNGIVFSVAAAQIISDLLKNKKDPDAGIFSFNR